MNSPRHIPFTLLCALALSLLFHAGPAALYADNAPAIESRMPGGASLFVRAENATILARALAAYRDHIAPGAGDPPAKWFADFRAKTGIDVTDAQSLKKAGIDVDKPLALAKYAAQGTEGYLAFLPVTSGRNFPYSFTKLLKQLDGDGKHDLNPAITRHGTHAVFQVLRDIFFTADGDYFILASSGALLTNTLDLGIPEKRKETLTDDASYGAFRSKLDSPGGLLLYNRDGAAGKADVPARRAGIVYSGARFDADSDALKGRVVFALDPGNGDSSALLAALKTGLGARCPHLEEMTFYLHLAVDLKSIAARCAGPGDGTRVCEALKQGMGLFENYFSLELSRELLPRSGKSYNFFIRKSPEKGKPDDYLLHVSKDTSITARDLKRSLYREIEKRAADTGEEMVGTTESLQATDQRGGKTLYVVDDRGIFISNSRELMARGLEPVEKSLPEVCGLTPGVPAPGEPFVHARLNFREASVIKTMMQLASYNSRRRLYNFLSGADTVTATGYLSGAAVIFDFSAKLQAAQKNNGR
jgi:hypothetical protein